jgi:hypothetical protein
MAGQKHAVAVANDPKPPIVVRRETVSEQRKKAFNCIVDESALIAGVKAPGLFPRWIQHDYIRIFVPLQSA